MSLFSNMNDKSAMRAWPWLWYIRLVQIVITLLILVLAALDAKAVQDFASGCGVAPRIAWNLACAVLTIVAVVYFILATGPSNVFKVLPWLVWGQLALDAVMFIFWIAATATSTFSYKDLCDACPYDLVEYAGFVYECITGLSESYDDFNPDYDVFSRGLAGVQKRAVQYGRSKRGTALGRTALDAIMTVLFAITLAATIWWISTQRRSSGTAAPTMKPPTHEESGVPMTSTQQSASVAPNSQTQPVQYYVVQGQPQLQQQEQQYGFQQPAPQAQYPPQPQQQFVPQQQQQQQ
ncbi:hypothetical protein MMC29_003218 [Sticta canariensis]|nr:hypothetical protein [Sticta canariensis]